MKVKIILGMLLTVFLIANLSFSVYCEESVFSESDSFCENADDYVPQYIKDILDENDIDETDTIDPISVLKALCNEFALNINDNTRLFLIIMCVIIATSLVNTVLNENYSDIIRIPCVLSIIYIIINIFLGNLNDVQDLLCDFSQLLTVLISAFSAVFLLGGASFSAVAATSSGTILLGITEKLFVTHIFDIAIIVVCLFIFEQFSAELRSTQLTKNIKKTLISFTVFIFSLVIALVSMNCSLAAAKDSASLRTLKFATSNIVPIIGSSASEAMKTVTIGVDYIRTYIGISSAYALTVIVFPVIAKLMIFKWSMNFFALIARLLSVEEFGCLFDGFADISDIFFSIVVALSICTSLLLLLFMNLTLSIT